MKGLNIKKVVALGIGAALIGSALAPVVSAANMAAGGLDNLERSNIISSTGMPVVDIVVGSNAAVSDVVWAGNIAAKVAQLATIPAGEATMGGEAKVNVTVGGQLVTTGAGETAESNLDFNNQEANLFGIEVSDTQVPYLVNNTNAKLKWAGTDITTSVQETVTGNINAVYQGETSSSRVKVGELVGSVAKDGIEYRVALGTDLNTEVDIIGMDASSSYDVKLPFLGKTYVLDEIDASEQRLVLYANTTPTDLLVGQTIPVTPASAYSGKTMIVELVDLVQTGSGTNEGTYEAKWALKVDGAVEKIVQRAPKTAYNLKDEFGSGYFSDDVYVTAAGLNLAANTYTATIRSGTDRIELRDGYGFPYTGDTTIDQDAQWRVIFTDGAVANKSIKAISLKNNWSYTKTSGDETVNSKYVLGVGEQIALPNDYSVLKFLGFESKTMLESKVGNNMVSFKDLKGSQISIPLETNFTLDVNRARVTLIGGQNYTFWLTDVNAYKGDADNDMAVYYKKGDYSAVTAITGTTWDNNLDLNYGYVPTADIMLDVGAKDNSSNKVDINYNILVDKVNTRAFLLLADQTFNLYNKAKSGATLSFLGTMSDENTIDAAYFRPNTSELGESLSGFTYDADKYYAAMFNYNDLNGKNAGLFLRADEAAGTWDYESIKDETAKYGPTKDANYANWPRAIRGGNDYLLSAFTADGSEIVSEGGEFVISYPDEQRKVQAYLGSSATSQTAVGGTSFTNLADGATETKNGIQVTIDAVSGVSTGPVQGVVVKPVANNIVKTDASTNGKSIIVGGWMVNAAAMNLEVSGGQKLQDLITANGEYVAAVLTNGSIVVAGYTSADTGKAASDLINALEGLM